MPQSKTRKEHKHHIDYVPHKKKQKSIVPAAIILCAVLALGISWFASDGSIVGIIIGAIIGAVIGYFAGSQMDKAFSNK